jgi:hypothetical protein
MGVYTKEETQQAAIPVPSGARNLPSGNTNPDSELDPASKRLLLSAHLGAVHKKLRRGLSVEEREILALLPFTIPDGATCKESRCDDADSAWRDEDWARRVADAGAALP